ncbi:MAG: TonB-dependent receptor [Bacteroidetes bacterium]|nr:TonB-dependent receptor [Bacteroidota bacterium]
MKHIFQKTFLLILLSHALTAQSQKHTISGYVKDAASGEMLIGANVYLKENLKGTTTNVYGFYSITVEQGNYTLVARYLGYTDNIQPLKLTKDERINISLVSKAIEAKAIEVTGERKDNNVQSTTMGRMEIDVEKAKTLPAFMGEVDLMKTIQLLPGVQSAGEGNSGFYVRGGGPDQNLILLDEAPVYNASHLFGFFSVFNADAVKNLTLTKGGMPANYGGRLASVVDITMKEGNNQKFHGAGGLGFIASRLTIEGPIKKDTSSFMISGRRTFIDLFLREPFIKKDAPAAGNSYFFYDLNAKVNYRFSDKDRLFLSGYFGRDVFSFNSPSGGFKADIPWGNATGTLRWNHLFSDKLFVNTSAIFTDYNFSFGAGQDDFEFKLFSGVRDWSLKSDFDYFPSILHHVKFGANYVYHIFTPSSASAKQGDVEFDLGEPIKLRAHDFSAYITDDWSIDDKWTVTGGVRLTNFMFVGPFDRYIVNEFFVVTDTIHYGKNTIVKNYPNAEPRFLAKYSLNSRSSLKASFTQNYQYIHLASVSSVSLPTDVWVPSSDRVKPQKSTQYALGYFRNFLDDMFESSVEVYYKDMRNQIEYRDGASQDEDVKNNQDNNFVFGKGWSYGAEFFLKKVYGDFNGWIGYTLAYTNRQFDEKNLGKAFPAKYDRRHDVSIVLIYSPNKKWTFGATWVYATGNATTLPQDRYLFVGALDVSNPTFSGFGAGNQIYNSFTPNNSFRLKPYHRLDLSATYYPKPRKRYEASWNFSIFNAYNRYNPYFIYFDASTSSGGDLSVQAKQVSLFPIIPSVTYNFNF